MLQVALFLPATLIAKFSRERLDQQRDAEMARDRRWKGLVVRTEDGIRIDAMQWLYSDEVCTRVRACVCVCGWVWVWV